MSWLRTKNSKPDFTSLQIQTATSTLAIPICWGQNKLSPNVVWYANFQTNNGSSGKGGLFSSSSAEATFAADIIMALCEGPVGGIGYIWRDQGTYTLSGLGLTFFEGNTPQSEWSYLTSAYPNQALPYQGTAFVCAASYQLGDNASVGNHNFEILGIGQSSGANGIDCDPAWWIYDFLTNAQYGAGFPAATINSSTLFTSGVNSASLQSYCNAMGIAISPCLTTQEPASSILSRVLQQLNCAAVWSQGELKFVPYGDQTISAGNVTTSVQTGVPQPSTSSAGGTPPPEIIVCSASAWVSDGGVTYTFTGSGMTYVGASTSPAQGQYGITPSGTYLFSTADEGAAITITYTYAIRSSYVPNLTPVYCLVDTDFLSGGSEDPVRASRADPFALPNIVRLEVLSRSNQYAGTVVEARDQSQIELYGPRVGSTITSHEICDDVTVAPIVAQTILQRGLYVRTKFTFRLGLEFCLLDPMDIVEISDSNLGLNSYPVRITSIEEDDYGDLTIEAEELVNGVSTPGGNPGRGVSGYKPNQAAPADPVNANPLIYEPPPGLTNNALQIWVGASGGAGGVADPNWGGAYVWISLDNVTYNQFGAIVAPLRQGALTAGLSAGSGWDTTDTLSVSLAESAGKLTGTSIVSAQQGVTLCLVGNELIAYEAATLVGPNAYNLTGLARGLYGTQPTIHPSGSSFYRLNSAVLKSSLASQYIGQTLYFKFQSFNSFGSGVQDLSTCIAYSHMPNGQGAIGPIAAALAAGSSLNFGTAVAVTQTENWGDGTSAISIQIGLGSSTP